MEVEQKFRDHWTTARKIGYFPLTTKSWSTLGALTEYLINPILRMDEILHHFESMVETIVCWYLHWGIDSFPGAGFRFRPSRVSRAIGVLCGCFARRIDGPGLPGGLIIYQGHLFPPKGHLCPEPFRPGSVRLRRVGAAALLRGLRLAEEAPGLRAGGQAPGGLPVGGGLRRHERRSGSSEQKKWEMYIFFSRG